ncbi:DUF2569 domain-containing protein [Endozoicomonas ascidiicola]|uniref:DUF2569 domain-containing protein n=1 Tax=Endozoicomonas ascidiicola TaxID=1698521 RepID=UPI0008349626|nr:DUF2569 domain-containing protein [Endozoicomonas ascidiicola]
MIKDKNLSGLGGWLLLVGFGLIFSSLRLLYFSITTFSDVYADGVWTLLTTSSLESYIPYWGTLIISELIFNVFSFTACVYLVYLFFRKSNFFPKAYIFVGVFTVAILIIDAFASILILPELNSFDDVGIKEITRSLVGALVWIPYMLKSKRVKNTFVSTDSGKEIKVFAVIGLILSFAVIIPLVNDAQGYQSYNDENNTTSVYESERDSINNVLAKTAKQINMNLPMMVDEETRLDLTMGLDHSFLYKYTLVNFKADELDSEYLYSVMKPMLTENVCTNEDMKVFLELNIPVEYAY